MRGSYTGCTFVPLFPEPWGEPSRQRLSCCVNPQAPMPVTCVQPPVPGLDFLAATGQVASILDRWWQERVPAGSLPVLLMSHEADLQAWVNGLDAVFVIGVESQTDRERYDGCSNVSVALVREGPMELTDYAMRLYSGEGWKCFLVPAPGPFGPAVGAVGAVAAVAVPAPVVPTAPASAAVPAAEGNPAPAPAGPPRPAPSRWVETADQLPNGRHAGPNGQAAAAPSGSPRNAGAAAAAAVPLWVPPSAGARVPDPIQSLAAARPTIDRARPGAAPAPARQPARAGWPAGPPAPPPSAGRPATPNRSPHRRPTLGTLIRRASAGLQGGRRGEARDELARLALAHRQGKIVSVISRAGGVGTTAIVAAVGIIYGEAVEDNGGSAAVVDQNLDNPDQWGRLELDGRVRTVSEIMADIEGGREWSIPAWNRTPGLAIYPERRAVVGGYTPVLIERFADRLRSLHMISVVDLPNCLPTFGPGKAGVSAGWLRVADLVTIPTTDDPTRLHGVIELLDTPLIRGDAHNGYRSLPVVVAYVRSPLRAVRQNQGVLRLLDQIRDRVVEVVEIPRDERATLAVVTGRPITEINPALRRAYVELSLAIARGLSDA